jgi:hypothetical protein
MYIPRTPHFSEFSYGFAVARELVTAEGEAIRIAPVFPSLIQEAQLGWDLFVDRPGMPLYLQFKLSDCMKGQRAREVKDGFNPPFFRFHLRCSADNNQHSLLLELNNRGEDVRYIAPAFFQNEELNAAYNDRQVIDRSIQLTPADIGNLVPGRHHVAFAGPNGPWKPYSDGDGQPRSASSAREIIKSVELEFRSRPRHSIRDELERIDAELTEVFASRKEETRDFRHVPLVDVQQRMAPLERIEFIARYFFDCQLFFAFEK